MLQRQGMSSTVWQRLSFLAGGLLTIVAVSVIGTNILTGAHAASLFGSLEAETGSLSGVAAKVNDGSASNGSAVRFGNASAPSPSPSPSPSPTPPPASPLPPAIDSTWRLTFDDRFSGNSVNTSLWQDGGVNWWKSNYNHDQEGYTISQCSVANNILTDASAKVPITSYGITYPYRACMLDTYDSFSQLYGYFEFVGQVPRGDGYWPAFWLYNQAASSNAEIDIMENLGEDTSTYYATYHPPSGGQSQYTYHGVDLSAGFHTYAAKWTPGSLTFYFDNTPEYTVTSGVYAQKMFLLIDLAIGGDWPVPVDSSTPWPGNFLVKSAKVWSLPTDTSNPIVP